MKAEPASLLRQLEELKASYGAGLAEVKLDLLSRLERRRLATADEVLRLHECLCFWRAYPDDERVLTQVERMLAAFSSRGDLRRRRSELADSGIAGTPTYYSFFWPTARWLVRHWPEQLAVNWSAFGEREELAQYLSLLVSYSETPALDMLVRSQALVKSSCTRPSTSGRGSRSSQRWRRRHCSRFITSWRCPSTSRAVRPMSPADRA